MYLATFLSIVQVTAQEDTSTRLKEAFEAVSKAEEMGGDVKELVESLNEALSLLEEAEQNGDDELKNDALSIIEKVVSEASKASEEGLKTKQTQIAMMGITMGVLAVLCIVTWRYLAKLFWNLWVKNKRKWKVKT